MTSPTPITSASGIVRTDAPASTTRWQHTKGTCYTVLVVSNGDSDRPDEYPETVVYQDDNGKVWSRPLSRWHGSMTEVPETSTQDELVKRAETPAGDDPLLSFDSSMSRDEVARQFQRLVARARNQPAKETSLVGFEWLSTMWTAVSVLENRAASVAERQAAANGLRVRLENEVASPDGRKPAAAQIRSPEVGTDSPWFPLPLDEVAKAEGNGYDVRYLFDHAEGAPVVGVLRVEDGIRSHQLVNHALYLQDGAYALHAMSISLATADALEHPPAPAVGSDSFA